MLIKARYQEGHWSLLGLVLFEKNSLECTAILSSLVKQQMGLLVLKNDSVERPFIIKMGPNLIDERYMRFCFYLKNDPIYYML